MTRPNKRLLVSLLFPILALVALTGYKAYKQIAGVQLTIPITGYDPRDLLSGHYLTYRLDFKQHICPGYNLENQMFVCVVQLDNYLSASEVSSPSRSSNPECTAIIRGNCDQGRFTAGVERFYIPEQHSVQLDRIVRGWGANANRAKLVISVDRHGKAVAKNLLIDDKPWQDYLAETAAVTK